MKRRELIKTGVAALAACSLGGCSKENSSSLNNAIKPRQTDVYKISTAMPFDFKLIDEIAEMNTVYKKAKITTLYNNTPLPTTKNYDSFVMILRGNNFSIKNHDDFLKYAKYAMDKGFEICYLMNSPKPFSENDFKEFKDDFYKLLDKLYRANINHIKIANTQLATLINNYNSNFKLSASTAFEYHNTSQYVNLLHNYPNIDLFDIAIDENHNFPFLKNLKKIFPKKEIELMVNECCMKGCPARISHISELNFCAFQCKNITRKNQCRSMFKFPAIFPWDLDYYSAIGINNFKITQRWNSRADIINLSYLKHYLDCLEFGYDDWRFDEFYFDVFGLYPPEYFKKFKLSDVKQYLQDIKYFTEYGDLCASRCGATCNRCEKLGIEFEKIVKKYT